MPSPERFIIYCPVMEHVPGNDQVLHHPGKEIFLWQDPTSVDVLCYDLIAESLILYNRKRIDGTGRW